MFDYPNVRNRIETIIECNLPIVDKEYRDLLLDSIMTTLRDCGLQPYDFQNEFIYGYRIKDLVIVAERLRENHIDEFDLQKDNESFLAGYNLAVEHCNKQIEECTNKIIMNDVNTEYNKVKKNSIYGEMKEAKECRNDL